MLHIGEGGSQKGLRGSENVLFERLSFCVCQKTVEIPRMSRKVRMYCEFIAF